MGNKCCTTPATAGPPNAVRVVHRPAVHDPSPNAGAVDGHTNNRPQLSSWVGATPTTVAASDDAPVELVLNTPKKPTATHLIASALNPLAPIRTSVPSPCQPTSPLVTLSAVSVSVHDSDEEAEEGNLEVANDTSAFRRSTSPLPSFRKPRTHLGSSAAPTTAIVPRHRAHGRSSVSALTTSRCLLAVGAIARRDSTASALPASLVEPPRVSFSAHAVVLSDVADEDSGICAITGARASDVDAAASAAATAAVAADTFHIMPHEFSEADDAADCPTTSLQYADVDGLCLPQRRMSGLSFAPLHDGRHSEQRAKAARPMSRRGRGLTVLQ